MPAGRLKQAPRQGFHPGGFRRRFNYVIPLAGRTRRKKCSIPNNTHVLAHCSSMMRLECSSHSSTCSFVYSKICCCSSCTDPVLLCSRNCLYLLCCDERTCVYADKRDGSDCELNQSDESLHQITRRIIKQCSKVELCLELSARF